MNDQGVVRKPPVPGRKFIAVDLDGTLAIYDKTDNRTGRTFIGEPIPAMVARVKDWLAQGHVVCIFTSRVAEPSRADHFDVLARIHAWCEQHIGERLMVTAIKQPYFSAYYDNEAIQVRTNTGELVA